MDLSPFKQDIDELIEEFVKVLFPFFSLGLYLNLNLFIDPSLYLQNLFNTLVVFR